MGVVREPVRACGGAAHQRHERPHATRTAVRAGRGEAIRPPTERHYFADVRHTRDAADWPAEAEVRRVKERCDAAAARAAEASAQADALAHEAPSTSRRQAEDARAPADACVGADWRFERSYGGTHGCVLDIVAGRVGGGFTSSYRRCPVWSMSLSPATWL